MKETKNLMDGIDEQITRVKDIIKVYKSLPFGAGNFAASFMEQDVSIATKARNQGDTVQMLKSYQELKKYEL